MNRRKMVYEQLHPLVGAAYLIGIILITMLNMHPLLLALSFAGSFFYASYATGKMIWKRSLLMAMPFFFFSMVVMPLFYHNGVTPLFYINERQVTLETILHGFAMSVLLLSVIQWFQVWNLWIDSEKFLYLFGRISPSLTLLVSMVFRMIPLLLQRWKEIGEVQKGTGYTKEISGMVEQVRFFLKKISILISWSLENSIDTSISMENRGYGTGKRTSFHLFRWNKQDGILLIFSITLVVSVIVGIKMNVFFVSYFPKIQFAIGGKEQRWIMGCFLTYILLPGILELFELCLNHKKKRCHPIGNGHKKTI